MLHAFSSEIARVSTAADNDRPDQVDGASAAADQTVRKLLAMATWVWLRARGKIADGLGLGRLFSRRVFRERTRPSSFFFFSPHLPHSVKNSLATK